MEKDSTTQKTFQILLVEDNLSDAKLTVKVLQSDKTSSFEVRVVEDGVQALAFLNRESPFQAVPSPDLVLLDLNIPKIDGVEVLSYIKQHEKLNSIPVMILSTSDSHFDREKCEKLKANSYMVKPMNYIDFLGLIDKVKVLL